MSMSMMSKVGMGFVLVSFILFLMGLEMLLLSEVIFVDYVVGGSVWGFSSVWIFDWLSVFFYSVVLMISGLIMFYSLDYMSGDCNLDRFVYLMLGFVLSMGLVVFSSNIVFLLFGWDGLGLVSYCLVIYYQNNRSFNAGMITILSNRVGDVGLLGGIALLIGCGDLNFVESVLMFDGVEGFVVGLLLLAGITSSAQVPFSAWLPAAMAAPTPVSSLVHSSTLVAAGVYLMIRLSDVLGFWSEVLFVIGVVTMFMAGIGANFESDLSKVVALSTLSQLGVMMMIVSLGEWELGYYHMVIHALFKAMMFMCVGFVIHGLVGWQDERVMGGLGVYFPFIGGSLMVSGMALMGFPFLAGFYSSDLILESVLMWSWGVLGVIVIVISFIMTVMYSISIFKGVLWGGSGVGIAYVGWSEGSFMIWSILGLVFMSVFGGSSLGWVLLPYGELVILGWESMIGLLIVMVGVFFGMVFSVGGGFMGDFFGGMWFLWFLSGNPIVGLLEMCGDASDGDDLWGEVIGGSGMGVLVGSGVNSIVVIQEQSLSGLLMAGLLVIILGFLI